MKKILITSEQNINEKHRNNFDYISNSPIKEFQNGEIRNRIYWLSKQSITNADVYVYHRFSKTTINKDILWLLLITKLLCAYTPDVTLILPFLPYTRKDRSDLSKDYIDQQVIIDLLWLLKQQWAKKIITTDLHNPNISHFAPLTVIDIPFKTIFHKRFKQWWCIISPDMGAAKKTLEIAEENKLESIILHKKRKTDEQTTHINQIYKTETEQPNLDIFYITDDMMDTWGTLLKSIEFIQESYNPQKIYIYITHLLLSGNGEENLRKILKNPKLEFVSTNSFKHQTDIHIETIQLENLLFETACKP